MAVFGLLVLMMTTRAAPVAFTSYTSNNHGQFLILQKPMIDPLHPEYSEQGQFTQCTAEIVTFLISTASRPATPFLPPVQWVQEENGRIVKLAIHLCLVPSIIGALPPLLLYDFMSICLRTGITLILSPEQVSPASSVIYPAW